MFGGVEIKAPAEVAFVLSKSDERGVLSDVNLAEIAARMAIIAVFMLSACSATACLLPVARWVGSPLFLVESTLLQAVSNLNVGRKRVKGGISGHNWLDGV